MTKPKITEETKKTDLYSESIDSERLHLINRLTSSHTAKSTLKETLKNVMLVLDSMFKPEVQIIHILDRGTEKLESYFSDNSGKTYVKKSHSPIDEKTVRGVIETGKTVVMTASKTRLDGKPKALHLSSDIPESTMIAPLSTKGRSVGAIEFLNKASSEIFTKNDSLLIDSIKDIISIVIENHILHEKTIELSIFDYVSGLYNLRHFKQLLLIELERSDRTSKPLSIIFFDLDFFKKVNDTHGHIAGSSALNNIGNILKKDLRKTDISARFGGDEFVIILPQTNEAQGRLVAERLRKLIANTKFHIKDNSNINVTASFGVAVYPTHSSDPEELIDLSDKAMYMVKQSGRNGVMVYQEAK